MGNAASKKKVEKNAEKNLISSLQQEVEFTERLITDRKWFTQTKSVDTMNAKGAFLLAVYNKLSSSAVHLYKVSHRIELQKSKKPEMSGSKKTVVEVQKELEQELNTGLGEWNNADAAAQWLLHDYDISSKTVHLNLPEKKENEETNPDKLREKENRRKKELERLMAETKRLKTEALEVGFHYLDTNYSGYLEPADIPTISAPVFAKLDATGKHRLAWKDIQKAIGQMENTVNNGRAETAKLSETLGVQGMSLNQTTDAAERGKIEEQMGETRVKYNQVLGEMRSEERILNDVYEMFRQAFTRNVFDVLPHGQHADALPTLSRAVKETYHVEEIPAPPKTTEPWMSSIGADILHPDTDKPMALPSPLSSLSDAEMLAENKDKSYLNVPVVHTDTAPPTPTPSSTAQAVEGLRSILEQSNLVIADNLHQLQDASADAQARIQDEVAAVSKSMESLKTTDSPPTTTTRLVADNDNNISMPTKRLVAEQTTVVEAPSNLSHEQAMQEAKATLAESKNNTNLEESTGVKPTVDVIPSNAEVVRTDSPPSEKYVDDFIRPEDVVNAPEPAANDTISEAAIKREALMDVPNPVYNEQDVQPAAIKEKGDDIPNKEETTKKSFLTKLGEFVKGEHPDKNIEKNA